MRLQFIEFTKQTQNDIFVSYGNKMLDRYLWSACLDQQDVYKLSQYPEPL